MFCSYIPCYLLLSLPTPDGIFPLPNNFLHCFHVYMCVSYVHILMCTHMLTHWHCVAVFNKDCLHEHGQLTKQGLCHRRK